MSSLYTALVSGALAGLAVDLSLFPIDTIKTRLQSENGFYRSGGFRGVYAGISSVAVGSAPGAAVFFLTYEATKNQLSLNRRLGVSANHMISSSIAEVAACLIRVPTEVIKQRSQAGHGMSTQVLKSTIASEGAAGLYRGFFSTITREIPFSMIQFPLWEFLKKRQFHTDSLGIVDSQVLKVPLTKWSRQGNIEPWKSATSGAIAGSLAAFLTTPLDVAKTRIMLSQKSTGGNELTSISAVLSRIYKTDGVQGLWAGGVPRVLWIALGGFIFLGVYDTVKYVISKPSKIGQGDQCS